MLTKPTLSDFSYKRLRFFAPSYASVLACLLLIMAGCLYISSISFSVKQVSADGRNVSLPINNWPNQQGMGQARLVIESKFARTSRANIIASRGINEVRVNGELVRPVYPYPKTRTSYRDAQMGDVYKLPLKSGKNTITVQLRGKDWGSTFKFGQKYHFSDYLVVALLIVLPLAWLGVHLLIQSLKLLKPAQALLSQHKDKLALVYLVLAAGIVLRIIYWWDMGYIQFQHDYRGHVEYIEFIAREFFVPMPHKAWEFPQQPLYYIVNGGLWALLAKFGVNRDTIIFTISGLGMALNCVGLFYALRLLRLLDKTQLFQALTLAFLCFTPTLVYVSTRLNNDTWVVALAMIALFYIVAAYQHHFEKHAYKAILATTALFLTKISSLVFELLLFTLLLISYHSHAQTTKKPLIIFATVGAAVLSYTLFKAYYPGNGQFHFVNSGVWPGQHITNLDISYFFSFNFSEILHFAQAKIGEEETEAITRSFWSYQYTTMLFGEFGYDWWRGNAPFLYFKMQLVLIFSLIVPLAWAVGFFSSKNLMERLFVAGFLIGFALQLKFIFEYPSVSNTDFRYYASLFFILAFFFAKGIESLCTKLPKIANLIKALVCIKFALDLLFITTLISI